MSYLLGIDVGTSGTKSVLIDDRGQVKAAAGHSHPTFSPLPGYQEQDSDDWWAGVCSSVGQVLKEAAIDAGEITAISFSGQGCACLPVDASGQALGRALIWTDSRSTPQQNRIREMFGAELGRVVGNQIYDQPEPRMMWIRDNEPERYQLTYKFLTTVSYLVYRFTGVMAGSTSDWGFHLAFDRSTGSWNSRFCQEVGLDLDKFPCLFSSHELVGRISPEAAKATGLKAGTPVVTGGQDTPIITLAAGAVDPGQSAMMRGTTDLLCVTRADGDYHPDLYTTCSVLPGRYVSYDMKEVVAAGGSYKWLADTLFGEVSSDGFEEMNRLASQVPAGANGLLYLPYLLISTNPDPSQHRAGAFFGLRTTTSRADMCRAVLEGTAFALRETIGRLAASGIDITELRLTGGPATSLVWNQITADVTGLPVLVPQASGGSAAFGAALLAGLGSGVFPLDDNWETLQRIVDSHERLLPNAELRASYDRHYAAFVHLAVNTAGIAPAASGS